MQATSDESTTDAEVDDDLLRDSDVTSRRDVQRTKRTALDRSIGHGDHRGHKKSEERKTLFLKLKIFSKIIKYLCDNNLQCIRVVCALRTVGLPAGHTLA